MSNEVSDNGYSQLDQIFEVLDRKEHIPAVDSLLQILGGESEECNIRRYAIGIDANVALKLPNISAAEDVIDYLKVQHTGPLVLPGQVIQEFWNNQLSAINTIPKDIGNKFKEVRKAANRIREEEIHGGENVAKLSDQMEAALQDFEELAGVVYQSDAKRRMAAFFDLIKYRGVVPFCPRSRFSSLAEQRKRTKTPPGFMDSGDGDFFVWVDFLYGIFLARSSSVPFERIVFVSDDSKKDWSLRGHPHPILAAEIKALFGVEFEIWNLKKFVGKIQE